MIPGERHPATEHIARWLTPNPNLPDGPAARVAEVVHRAGAELLALLPDGPEVTAGLRKLVEAKDCLVRAALDSDPVTLAVAPTVVRATPVRLQPDGPRSTSSVL